MGRAYPSMPYAYPSMPLTSYRAPTISLIYGYAHTRILEYAMGILEYAMGILEYAMGIPEYAIGILEYAYPSMRHPYPTRVCATAHTPPVKSFFYNSTTTQTEQ